MSVRRKRERVNVQRSRGDKVSVLPDKKEKAKRSALPNTKERESEKKCKHSKMVFTKPPLYKIQLRRFLEKLSLNS